MTPQEAFIALGIAHQDATAGDVEHAWANSLDRFSLNLIKAREVAIDWVNRPRTLEPSATVQDPLSKRMLHALCITGEDAAALIGLVDSDASVHDYAWIVRKFVERHDAKLREIAERGS